MVSPVISSLKRCQKLRWGGKPLGPALRPEEITIWTLRFIAIKRLYVAFSTAYGPSVWREDSPRQHCAGRISGEKRRWRKASGVTLCFPRKRNVGSNSVALTQQFLPQAVSPGTDNAGNNYLGEKPPTAFLPIWEEPSKALERPIVHRSASMIR